MRPSRRVATPAGETPTLRAAGVALLTAVMAMALAIPAVRAQAQDQPGNTNGHVANQSGPTGAQNAPAAFAATIPQGAGARYQSSPILSLPEMFVRQWYLGKEAIPVDQFAHTEDSVTEKVTLKEAIYLALRNNPGLESVALDPVAATESVKSANAVFDPQLSSQLDVEKQVTPVGSPFQNPGSVANTQKFYDWNFGLSKVLSLSNGSFGLTFNNDRQLTNSASVR